MEQRELNVSESFNKEIVDDRPIDTLRRLLLPPPGRVEALRFRRDFRPIAVPHTGLMTLWSVGAAALAVGVLALFAVNEHWLHCSSLRGVLCWLVPASGFYGSQWCRRHFHFDQQYQQGLILRLMPIPLVLTWALALPAFDVGDPNASASSIHARLSLIPLWLLTFLCIIACEGLTVVMLSVLGVAEPLSDGLGKVRSVMTLIIGLWVGVMVGYAFLTIEKPNPAWGLALPAINFTFGTLWMIMLRFYFLRSYCEPKMRWLQPEMVSCHSIMNHGSFCAPSMTCSMVTAQDDSLLVFDGDQELLFGQFIGLLAILAENAHYAAMWPHFLNNTSTSKLNSSTAVGLVSSCVAEIAVRTGFFQYAASWCLTNLCCPSVGRMLSFLVDVDALDIAYQRARAGTGYFVVLLMLGIGAVRAVALQNVRCVIFLDVNAAAPVLLVLQAGGALFEDVVVRLFKGMRLVYFPMVTTFPEGHPILNRSHRQYGSGSYLLNSMLGAMFLSVLLVIILGYPFVIGICPGHRPGQDFHFSSFKFADIVVPVNNDPWLCPG